MVWLKNPKDSNIYRNADLRKTCDSFGVERKRMYPFSINIQSHSGLLLQRLTYFNLWTSSIKNRKSKIINNYV